MCSRVVRAAAPVSAGHDASRRRSSSSSTCRTSRRTRWAPVDRPRVASGAPSLALTSSSSTTTRTSCSRTGAATTTTASCRTSVRQTLNCIHYHYTAPSIAELYRPRRSEHSSSSSSASSLLSLTALAGNVLQSVVSVRRPSVSTLAFEPTAPGLCHPSYELARPGAKVPQQFQLCIFRSR